MVFQTRSQEKRYELIGMNGEPVENQARFDDLSSKRLISDDGLETNFHIAELRFWKAIVGLFFNIFLLPLGRLFGVRWRIGTRGLDRPLSAHGCFGC
jgi:hypothetical protein